VGTRIDPDPASQVHCGASKGRYRSYVRHGGAINMMPRDNSKNLKGIKKIVKEAKDISIKKAVKKTLKELDKAGNEPMQRG
jgi:hypothetical protein